MYTICLSCTIVYVYSGTKVVTGKANGISEIADGKKLNEIARRLHVLKSSTRLIVCRCLNLVSAYRQSNTIGPFRWKRVNKCYEYIWIGRHDGRSYLVRLRILALLCISLTKYPYVLLEREAPRCQQQRQEIKWKDE